MSMNIRALLGLISRFIIPLEPFFHRMVGVTLMLIYHVLHHKQGSSRERKKNEKCTFFHLQKKNSIFLHIVIEISWQQTVYERFTDQPINRPTDRISKSEKFQYQIGIGSADYNAVY